MYCCCRARFKRIEQLINSLTSRVTALEENPPSPGPAPLTDVPFAYVREEYPTGTGTPNSLNDMEQSRDLNNVVDNTIGDDFYRTGDSFHLEPGTYWISARAPAYNVGEHRLRLYAFMQTESRDIILGSTALADGTQTDAVASGYVTVAEPANVYMFHLTKRNTGTYGQPANKDRIEIYSEVRIWKLA